MVSGTAMSIIWKILFSLIGKITSNLLIWIGTQFVSQSLSYSFYLLGQHLIWAETICLDGQTPIVCIVSSVWLFLLCHACFICLLLSLMIWLRASSFSKHRQYFLFIFGFFLLSLSNHHHHYISILSVFFNFFSLAKFLLYQQKTRSNGDK